MMPPRSPEPNSGISALASLAVEELERLDALDRRRQLRAVPNSRIVDLTHNDYLGLRRNEHLKQAALDRARSLPFGAGASRLLGGEQPIFAELESAFADYKGAPSALYFGSGYAANEGVLGALSTLPGVSAFSDSLNHASLIDGLRLALPRDRRHVFPHNDVDALDHLLASSTSPVNLIITESLFSMDGDEAPLEKLAEIAGRRRGVLVIDEAHANFALGPCGRGLIARHHLDRAQLISIDTCGKAMAAQGAFVVGPAWLRDLLINKARPFIYSTGPSPWVAAALLVMVENAARFEAERGQLQHVARSVRGALKELGLNTLASAHHIVPVICGSEGRALAWAGALHERGIAAKAIRYPTVANGAARIRLSLHASLDDDDVANISRAFREIRDAE